MSMKTWINGAKGGEVRKVIETNFNTLFRHLSSNVLTLTTQERNLLGETYTRPGLRVYDITLDKWFKYSNGAWVECPSDYTYEFTKSDWSDGNIVLRADIHHIKNPVVELYMSNNDEYIPVIGGVSVDTKYNITLSTDMPFSGKVVVK